MYNHVVTGSTDEVGHDKAHDGRDNMVPLRGFLRTPTRLVVCS